MAITDAELDALAMDIKFEANRLRWRKLLREFLAPECGFAVEGLPLITCSDPRGHTGPHQFIRVGAAVPEPPDPHKDIRLLTISLLDDIRRSHRDPDSGNYNECEKPGEKCLWCDEADTVLAALRARPVEPPPEHGPGIPAVMQAYGLEPPPPSETP